MTTREGNELVVLKENCIVEEIKEVELRSRRGNFFYNRTFNCSGLNQVSQLYFRQNKLPLTTASLSGGRCPGCPGASTYGTASP